MSLLGVLGLGLIAACSGGGGGSAATTTTSSSAATSTTQATTTTTTVEDAVKAAYLAYWKMIDRLIAAPDPDDPELAQRAVDPILSVVRDDIATRRSEGRTTRPPANSKYAHHIQQLTTTGTSATVSDCYVDDRVQFGSDGAILDDQVATISATAHLTISSGDWRVSEVQIREIGNGEVSCGA